MNKREFNKLLLALSASGVGGFPISLSRAAGQAGGTLNAIIQPEPTMLNIAINQTTPAQTVAGKLFLGLVTYDFDFKPMPSLARSWSISSDGLIYTFNLEPTAKWHDGVALTADDVVYTVTEFLPGTHPRAKAVFGRCASVTALDQHTVEFKLKQPFGPFMGAFDVSNLPVMPKHIYAGSDVTKNPANLKPIGSGPFKFKEWVRGSHIHLTKNDDYFKPGKPSLDAIIYRVVPDGASRAVALEEGAVQLTQWTDLEFFDAQRLGKSPDFTLTTKGYEYFSPIMWLELNNRTPPLNDKRFRQAIMHAIDRDFIKDKILFGFGTVATGPVSSKTKFYEPNVRKYEFSTAKATELLDEMGLRPDASGVRTKLRLLVLPVGEMAARTCEYVRQSLGKVGINLTLESTDFGGWSQRVSNWDYDMTLSWLYQFGDPALGVTRNYISSNIRKILFTNTGGYSNPEVDRLAEAGASEIDPSKRQASYSAMQKILVEDVPIAWLVEMHFPTIHDKRYENLVMTALGVNDSFESATFKS